MATFHCYQAGCPNEATALCKLCDQPICRDHTGVKSAWVRPTGGVVVAGIDPFAHVRETSISTGCCAPPCKLLPADEPVEPPKEDPLRTEARERACTPDRVMKLLALLADNGVVPPTRERTISYDVTTTNRWRKTRTTLTTEVVRNGPSFHIPGEYLDGSDIRIHVNGHPKRSDKFITASGELVDGADNKGPTIHDQFRRGQSSGWEWPSLVAICLALEQLAHNAGLTPPDRLGLDLDRNDPPAPYKPPPFRPYPRIAD